MGDGSAGGEMNISVPQDYLLRDKTRNPRLWDELSRNELQDKTSIISAELAVIAAFIRWPQLQILDFCWTVKGS